MKSLSTRWFACLGVAVALLAGIVASLAHADVSTSEAVAIARQGKWPDEKTQSITRNGHGFYVRPFSVVQSRDGLTASGFFRHRHRGKDDRIYFEVVVKKGQTYQAKITKIHFRGPLAIANKVLDLGLDVADEKGFLAALKKKVNVSLLVDGNWIPEAREIVNEIARQLDAEVNGPK